ncbi:MAG: hypothetical protein M1838_001014 [Thelocarpon superellum]|nr:MAG: hypothetical protein M1838_001014 [Thelocarpon superellum]
MTALDDQRYERPLPMLPPEAGYTSTQRSRRRASMRSTRSLRLRSLPWMADTRSLALQASVRSRDYVRSRRRKSRSLSRHGRRPAIGAPWDFRRMEEERPRRLGEFRPLQLSIYLPENRLSPLPFFDLYGEEDEGSSGGLESPPPAHVPRTSVYSIPSSTMSIRRKPVGSGSLQRSSDTRRSIESRSTPATLNSEWTAQALRPRPSIPDSLASEDLSRSSPAKHTRSRTEPLQSAWVREVEPIRVSLGLEEPQDLLRKLQAFETIVEEGRGGANDSDTPPHTEYHGLSSSEQDVPPGTAIGGSSDLGPVRRRSSTFSDMSSYMHRPSAVSQPQLRPGPAIGLAVSPPRPVSRVSKWLFPLEATEVIHEDVSPDKEYEEYAGARRTITSSSAVSSISGLSTLDRPPSPTMTAPSSPGSSTPTRQRTFGHAATNKRRNLSEVFPMDLEEAVYPGRRLSDVSVGTAL